MSRRLVLPGGTDGDSPITVNLDKSYPLCDGCVSRPVAQGLSNLALYQSTDRQGWVTLMCWTHAHRWGVKR